MAYATQDDLVDRFGETELAQLADLIGNGEIDPAVVGRALGDADAEIDAALLGRYALPLAGVPPLLVRVACDLARETLYADHPHDEVKERAKRARDVLAGIAAGKLRLDAAVPTQADPAANLVEMVSGRRKTPFGG